MRQLITLVFFSLLICLPNHLLSQNYPILFNHYSGLPGNSVHDCAESNTGKLWVATDKGLAYYDGYSFKKVDLRNNLTTMFSWGFFKDKKGRLWLKNRQAPFTYIYNDSVHQVGSNKITGIYPTYFSEDNEGSIYIGSYNSIRTHKIDVDGNVTQIDSLLITINSKNEKIWHDANPYVYHKSLSHGDLIISMMLLGEKQRSVIEIWNSITDEKKIIPIDFLLRFDHLSYLDDDHVLLSGEAGIFKLNVNTFKIIPYDRELYNTFYKDIVVIYTDRYNNKWYCDYSKGLWFEKTLASFISYKYINENILSFSKTADKKIMLTTKEGSYTISSDGKVFNQKQLFPIPSDQDKIGSLSYITTSFLDLQIEHYNGSTFFYKEHITAANNKNIQTLPLDEWKTITPNVNYSVHIGSYKCFFQTDSILYIGSSSGVFSISYTGNKINVHHWNDKYVFGLYCSGTTLYTAGTTGLKKINIRTKQVETILNNPNIVNICSSKNYLFVREENGAILKIDKRTFRILETIYQYQGLQKIQMVGDEIWGIGETRILKLNPEDLSIINEINNFDGIIDPYKLGIEKIGSNYFLVCKNGFYRFNTSGIYRIDSEKSTRFNIESVFVNGNPVSGKQISLKGENNFLQINLQCIYFPFASRAVNFYYRINNGRWNISEQPTITIMNLPHGEHILEIKAKFRGSTTYFKKQLTLTINNPTPFYKSTLFFILVAVVIAASVVGGIIVNRKRKIKQLEQKVNVSQNRMKMLVMQMKPHFLSNIFNSLQTSFIEDNIIRTSQLIKDIDNYLRTSLLNSNKEVVSLYDEIKLARKYFLLEQNRLTKPIELTISEQLQNQMGTIMVPVFILQPIIENAIWHGIQNSCNEIGIIFVDLHENEDYYIISVEDNGVGFGESSQQGNSLAMSNINERLSLIDRNRMKKYVFAEKLTPGTKVSIYVRKSH